MHTVYIIFTKRFKFYSHRPIKETHCTYFSRTVGQRVHTPAMYPPVLSWTERERDTAQHYW